MVQGIEEGTKILLNEGVAVLAHGQEQPGVNVTGRSGRGRSQSAVIKKRVEPRQEFTVQSFSSDSPGNGADAYRPRLINLFIKKEHPGFAPSLRNNRSAQDCRPELCKLLPPQLGHLQEVIRLPKIGAFHYGSGSTQKILGLKMNDHVLVSALRSTCGFAVAPRGRGGRHAASCATEPPAPQHQPPAWPFS